MFTAPVLWFAAGVVLLGLEMLAPVGAFLFFASGCFAGWLAALADLSFAWQTGCATAACICSLFFLQKRLARVFSGRERDRQQDGAEADAAARASFDNLALAGRVGRVTMAILPGEEGQVEVAGSFWRAVSATPLEVGSRVRVQGMAAGDALLLEVDPLETGTAG